MFHPIVDMLCIVRGGANSFLLGFCYSKIRDTINWQIFEMRKASETVNGQKQLIVGSSNNTRPAINPINHETFFLFLDESAVGSYFAVHFI